MSTTFKDQLENHYPILVMQRDFDGVAELNERLFELIEGLAERYADTPENAVKSGKISTQGGYQTSTESNLFTLESDAVRELRDDILLPAVRTYLEAVFGDEASQMDPWLVGWANLLAPGDWQGPHYHPTDSNLASAVYYVRLPGDRPNPEGRIEFVNPIQASTYHGYSATRRLHPREGKLVLFPPYYMHYVHPFKGDRRRAVIAFDVLARRPGMQLVF
ncbi:MAG: putative 2OG-Fe(II) oxygenase [Xanthomonadales bacterium]|nr:putative 2OG-Fe(II) oxygenase [Xanthomonadales bacterium]